MKGNKLRPAQTRTAIATRVKKKAPRARSKIRLRRMTTATRTINGTINDAHGMIGRQDSYHMRKSLGLREVKERTGLTI